MAYQSIQTRCPRMGEHMNRVGGREHLPFPCDECYSLIVTSERIAWQPEVRWHEVEA